MFAIKLELKLNNQERTLMARHAGFSRMVYLEGEGEGEGEGKKYREILHGDIRVMFNQQPKIIVRNLVLVLTSGKKYR